MNEEDKKLLAFLLKSATEYLNDAYSILENNNNADKDSMIILTTAFNQVNGVLGDYEQYLENKEN